MKKFTGCTIDAHRSKRLHNRCTIEWEASKISLIAWIIVVKKITARLKYLINFAIDVVFVNLHGLYS